MILTKIPKDYNPKFNAVGSFIIYGKEIILLHRQDHKPQGNTWGIPSGKISGGEDPLTTACRETYEETGILVDKSEMNYFSRYFIRFKGYDFTYYIYHALIDNKVEIQINKNEHKDAKWIKPEESLKLPLIEDLEGVYRVIFWN